MFLLLWHQILESFLLKLGENPHGEDCREHSIIGAKSSFWKHGAALVDPRRMAWALADAGVGEEGRSCFRAELQQILSPAEVLALMPDPSLTTLAGVLGSVWRSAHP